MWMSLLFKTSQARRHYFITFSFSVTYWMQKNFNITGSCSEVGREMGMWKRAAKKQGITPEFLTWSKLVLLKLVPTVKESDRWKNMQSINKVKIPDSKILGLWLLVKIITSHFCISCCCSASNKCKIHIYMKCKWNIHQNGADAGP